MAREAVSPAQKLVNRYVFNGAVFTGLAALALGRYAWAAANTAEYQQLLDLSKEAWNAAPSALIVAVLSLVLVAGWFTRKYVPALAKPVYLIDTYTYKPPDRMKVSRENYIRGARMRKIWGEEALQFQEKLLNSSGLGDETYFPDSIIQEPMKLTWNAALEETEMVLFETVHKLLKTTGVDAQDIDILIVVCSCFAPTPSLASMVVNHFKMRTDVLSHNLSGMGCSSGVIGIDMARHYLQALPNKRALIVAHENITNNYYPGNNRSCLVSNCLFRVGGAACIMSNRPQDRAVAKYELVHSVRSHIGADDDAFNAIRQREDEDGIRGILLQRNVVPTAALALKTNIASLAPLVLPFTELAKCIMDKDYIPNFKTAFDHFLVHTGGRAVIEEVEKKLRLDPCHVQPSKETLFRYGNTCCAAVFYVLTNMESRVGCKKGEKVWMLGFGTGFKCNSAVLRALRDVKTVHEAWT
nr:3-ketoacyl-ACP synthase-2 [Coccomyxa sp. Obi]